MILTFILCFLAECEMIPMALFVLIALAVGSTGKVLRPEETRSTS